jgi:hypothetical protein
VRAFRSKPLFFNKHNTDNAGFYFALNNEAMPHGVCE